MLENLNQINLLYQVAEISYSFDMNHEIDILKTFNTKNDAISYIIDLYINDLLENNNFKNTTCVYEWRKIYGDLFSDWNKINIKILEVYLKNTIDKTNKYQEINKFLNDYNKWKELKLTKN